MGYDPKATKISKSVKRIAARIMDKALRRNLIRSYVEAERANINYRAPRRQNDK